MDAHDRPPVLIVDDQPRNLDALEAMLESSPCTPVRARTADEHRGLRRARDGRTGLTSSGHDRGAFGANRAVVELTSGVVDV